MPTELSSSQTGSSSTTERLGSALTICTVSYESGPFLAHNVPLVHTLNPGTDLSWLVAENSPDDSHARADKSLGIEVRPGVDPPSVEYQPASYHHGAALNALLPAVGTRHVVLMDPDFFVIEHDWIERCHRFVTERRLAFFGAPWHPKWITKPRGFPCPHFLWIDRAQVDLAALDFLPDGDAPPWQAVFAAKGVRRRVDRMVSRVVKDWMERRKVGRSRDTGCRVHERYATGTRYECLVPYYSPERHRPGGRGTRVSRFADVVLPPNLRLAPANGTYSDRGFAGFGLPDVDGLGWEEFMWAGRPFGFHVRGYRLRAKGRDDPNLADEVTSVLSQIAERSTQ